MLLWVTVLGLSGAALAAFSRQLPSRTLIAALGAQAALALGFHAFLLFASNPFARLDPPAPQGRGLNPLLQDPGFAFHPPTLYLGYVGLSVAFSLAVGAMLAGEVDRKLARAMRPWVLGAWIFLTLGITAGSYWAYYELGWGGWWFWDPVENASLMPWLAATALLHSVAVLAARNALKAWTMMLAVIAFSMSMVGTFLVRSGILTSVHAFAVDPTRGAFILVLLGLYVTAAFLLFAVRAATLREGAPFDPVSREAAIVVNNLLLTVILGIVFIGTLYPLMAEAVERREDLGRRALFQRGCRAARNPARHLACDRPVAELAAGEAPDVPQARVTGAVRGDRAGHCFPRFAAGDDPREFGLALAAGLIPAAILPLIGRNPLRTPLAIWGMAIAHLGAGGCGRRHGGGQRLHRGEADGLAPRRDG